MNEIDISRILQPGIKLKNPRNKASDHACFIAIQLYLETAIAGHDYHEKQELAATRVRPDAWFLPRMLTLARSYVTGFFQCLELLERIARQEEKSEIADQVARYQHRKMLRDARDALAHMEERAYDSHHNSPINIREMAGFSPYSFSLQAFSVRAAQGSWVTIEVTPEHTLCLHRIVTDSLTVLDWVGPPVLMPGRLPS